MKILVVGDWHSDLHEEEVYRSFTRMGHEVFKFEWASYFTLKNGFFNKLSNLVKRFQNKYVTGPLLFRINKDFLAKVKYVQPDVIFIYRGTHIQSSTLRRIHKEYPKVKLLGYNNDDPFSSAQPRYYWRHFLASVPVYDMVLAYRHRNIKEYQDAGAKSVDLLRSWFVPDRNYPVNSSPEDVHLYECDVVFIGHYESDFRVEYLEAIVKKGYKLRLYGPPKYWKKPLEKSSLLKTLWPVRVVWGAEYNRALCGAKIALCFLSKLNRDTYTRRCFEIPATKTMMLSEFSDDLASLFKNHKEAVFFNNKQEMIDKIDFYLKNEDARFNVANSGFEKVYRAGHDIDSRLNEIIKKI
jgi:spore maturation protein CgeB